MASHARRIVVSFLVFAACGTASGGDGQTDAASDSGAVSDSDVTGDLADGVDIKDGADTWAPGPDSNYPGMDVGDQDAWTTCPASQPAYMGNSACSGGLHCSYGTECCCGQCSPSYVCDCQGGKFNCYYTDFCLGPNCSPGCGFGQFNTPNGCATCNAIQAELPVALAAVITPLDACVATSDCASVDAPTGCAGTCSFALASDQTVTGAAALSQAATGWCSGNGVSCYVPCPQSGTPACVQGHCKLVGVCDPQVAPTGSACDDANPCTTGDTCTGPGQCTGAANSCDDGNSCTTDSCAAPQGCMHAANFGGCDSGVACSLGGVCSGGQCVDGGSKGWTVTLPKPEATQEGAVTRLADGSYVIGHTVLNQATVRAMRIDPAGKVLWDNANVATGHASDVRALADGTVWLAGYSTANKWPDGEARLWHLDAAGQLVQTTAIAAPLPGNVRLAVRPEGGLVVTGAYLPTLSSLWSGFVARVDAAGTLQGKTELGELGNGGGLTFPAARAGALGVLTSKLTPDGLTDLRFVRLDGAGVVQVDVPVLAAPSNDWPGGLVALADGWLGAAGTMTYDQNGKTPGGVLFRLNDAGAVVWQKTTQSLGSWLAVDGAGALVGGWTDASAGTPATAHLAHLDGAGVLTGETQVPMALLGNGSIWLAATGDAGALLVTVPGSGSPVHVMRVVPTGGACP